MRKALRWLSPVLLLIPLFVAQPILAQCGVERWSVKTGTDPDVGLINMSASTATTIQSLRGLATPATLPANNRVQPTETTIFTLNATLTQYKLESDSDYHLVLSDASGNTMIAEIPSPNCVGAGSPFGPGIQNARSEFDARFTATTSFQTANIPVAIKGVGFFDFLHGQTGVAPNGIELHAVLDIVFNPTAADFTIANSPTSLSLTQGTSGNSTITTAVSGGFNSAVSLSASGLPSGATATFSPSSIAAPGSGTSTLTISTASTTPAGTYSIAITGSGGAKTHTSTLSLTVNTAGGGGGTEALTDGGFESATSSTNSAPGWSGTSSVSTHNTIVVGTGNAHTGAANGYFGSANSETDTLTQTFSIPSTVSNASLTFWTNIVTSETTTTTAFDTLKVEIHNSSGTLLATPLTLSNLNATSDSNTTGTYFKPAAIDLTTYKGQTLQLVFRAATDSSLATTFRIDDVSVALTAGTGGSAPTITSFSPASGAVGASVTISGTNFTGATSVKFNAQAASFSVTNATTITATVPSCSSTGTISVTTPNGTATSSGTFTVTGCGATQLLGNPGFENGSTNTAPWTATSGVVDSSTSEAAHSGSWKAWMDGYGSAHTDSIVQTVAIPSSKTSATLTFWLHIDTAETSTTTQFDTLKVQVRNTSGTVLATLATYSNLNAATGYTQKSFNLNAYIGQTIQVYLVGTEDSQLQTSFVVDDFALNVQ